MKRLLPSSGVALLLVLWTLAILSTIALTLAASVGTEVRAGQESWNDLRAERLARSGHEIASYLETRALGTAAEDLTDVPVKPLIAGLSYRVVLDFGTVDLVLEGENGKLDVTSATEQEAASFFATWTGDPSRGREIAASIADWMDLNDELRPFGAESAWYFSQGYRPRNSRLGLADLILIKGLTPEDFAPSLLDSDGAPQIRESLTRIISMVSSGSAVNPNYASPAVLKAISGMTQGLLSQIIDTRARMPFSSAQDFRERMGIAADSPVLTRLTFTRGTTPAILATAHLQNSSHTRIERRVRIQMIDPRRGVPTRVLALVERNLPGE